MNASPIRLAPAPSVEPPYEDGDHPRAGLAVLPARRAEPLAVNVPAAIGDAAAYARRQAALRIMTTVCEVLARRRPLHQLSRLADQPVCEHVAALVRDRSVQPARGLPPVNMRSVRISEPGAHTAEVSAVLTLDSRVRAAAARIEGSDGNWRCTALRIL